MDRGQAHTLEGVIAGIVLIASLIFALQTTTVTPLSASTSNEYIGTQLKGIADGTIASESESESLKELVLNWNEAKSNFKGSGDQSYYTNPSQPPPPNDFIEALQAAYAGQGVVYNIYVQYERGDTINRIRLLYQGEPTDNAVSTSETITLRDKDLLTDTRTTLKSSTTYFAPDTSPETPLYTAVRIEVVVWRL